MWDIIVDKLGYERGCREWTSALHATQYGRQVRTLRRKREVKAQSAKAKGRKLQQVVRDGVLQRFPSLEPDER